MSTPASNQVPGLKQLKQSPRVIKLAIGLGLVGLLGVVALKQLNGKSVETSTTDKPTPTEEDHIDFPKSKWEAAGIEITPTLKAPLTSRVWRTGRVALNEDRIAHISPPAEGIIYQVPVRIGQTVKAGDTLAVIDSRELGQAKLELLKAKTALEIEKETAAYTHTTAANASELLRLLVAETPLPEIEKQLANKPIGDWRQQLLTAYTKRNQLRDLLISQKESGGAVSESNIRRTEAEVESATATYVALLEELRFQLKNRVRQADMKVKEAETSFNVARAMLLMFGVPQESIDKLDPLAEGTKASHLIIKAPFAGTIVEKHAVLSERVGPQFQMFVLADLSSVWIQADVVEGDFSLLQRLIGQSVVFRTNSMKEQAARVVYAGDLVDKTSRSLTLTAAASNADRLLKPGMFVEVGFEAGEPKPVLQVPTNAVLRHENKTFVFVQEGEDKFRRQQVTLGATAGERIAILEGLKEGDPVVVRGGFALKFELLKDQLGGE
jgi:cobalt-zinc-cadmium efflux system membrane fusion protein